MTRIRTRPRPPWHETATTDGRRPIVVAETPQSLLVRLKGTRRTFAVPWPVIWLRACEIAAGVSVRRHSRIRRGALAGI